MEDGTKWGTRCTYCNKKLLVIFKEDGLRDTERMGMKKVDLKGKLAELRRW